MIKPRILKQGDTIGIVSTASPLAGLVPYRLQDGIRMIEKLGFKVKLAPNASKVTGYTAGTAEERASDVLAMFADPEVKLIIAAIGGFNTNHILNLLDYEFIKKNPKIYIGYSDSTVLHLALQTQSDLVTFYGPAVLTQFGENPEIQPYTLEYFKKALMSSEPIGEVKPSKEWTDEILGWFDKKYMERARQMKPNPGWLWLKPGKASGKINGGCLPSMMHLRGTKFWPDFTGGILLWEIPESEDDFTKGEPLIVVDSLLTDLELSGEFSKITGMVVGRPFGYTDEMIEDLKKVILERTKNYNFPILYGVDTGHSDPLMTIPLGVDCVIDSDKDLFEISESGVE